MSYLDLYLSLDKSYREKGYNLCLFICPDAEIAVKEIIPKAVKIACESARKQNRRNKTSGQHWKIYLSDPQLFQIGLLEALHAHTKQDKFWVFGNCWDKTQVHRKNRLIL